MINTGSAFAAYKSGDRSPEVLQEIKSYYLTRDEVWIDSATTHHLRHRLQWIKKCLRLKPTNASILDIGSWTGTVANEIYQMGFTDITCLDISKKVCEVGEVRFPHLTFVHGDIDEWESDRRYDVIMACEVLEHIFKPLEVLAKIQSWLKTGGLGLVTVPIMKCYDENPEHISLVTREQLSQFGRVDTIAGPGGSWFSCLIRGNTL